MFVYLYQIFKLTKPGTGRKFRTHYVMNTKVLKPKSDFQVNYTTNLDMFKLMDNNRPINQSRVKRIYQSMVNEGLLVIPILVNKKMEIIDGQHRYQASKLSGKGLYYLQVDNYSEEQVVQSNQNSQSWSRKDFMSYFVSKGNRNYIKLQEFMKQFPHFSLTDSMFLLTNGTFTNTRKEQFNNGEFKISNYQKGVQWAEFITSLQKYFPEGYSRTIFVRAIVSVLRKYENEFNTDEFIKKSEIVPHFFKLCGNHADYVRMIEDIYNFKRRNDNKIFIRV
jgi:hypothetical protein